MCARADGKGDGECVRGDGSVSARSDGEGVR